MKSSSRFPGDRELRMEVDVADGSGGITGTLQAFPNTVATIQVCARGFFFAGDDSGSFEPRSARFPWRWL